MDILIAVPGSQGPDGIAQYFTGKKFDHTLATLSSQFAGQKNTLQVVVDSFTGIPEANKVYLNYPMNLNITTPIKYGGDMLKATGIANNDLYGRSVALGVRRLSRAISEIAHATNFVTGSLVLVGYSQGSEIVQSFLSSAVETLDSDTYTWFLLSFKTSILLANPVRTYLEENTAGNKCIGYPLSIKTGSDVIENAPVTNGALYRHRDHIALDVDKSLLGVNFNVYWLEDPIPSTKPGTKGSIGNILNASKGSALYHVDYRKAKGAIDEIVESMGFTINSGAVLDLPTMLWRHNEVLKRKYHPEIRLTANAEIAWEYLINSVAYGQDLLDLYRIRNGNVDTSLTVKLGLSSTENRWTEDIGIISSRLVEVAVWVYASGLLSDKMPGMNYFMAAREYLKMLRNVAMKSPSMLFDRANLYVQKARNQGEQISSAMASEIEQIGRGPRRNGAVLGIVSSWGGFEVPGELVRWDGVTQESWLGDILKEALDSIKQRGNTFLGDLSKIFKKK